MASKCPHAWRMVLDKLDDEDLARAACVNRELRGIARDIRERRDEAVLSVLRPVFDAVAQWLEGVDLSRGGVDDLERRLRAACPVDANRGTLVRYLQRSNPALDVLRCSFWVGDLEVILRGHSGAEAPWKPGPTCWIYVVHDKACTTVSVAPGHPPLCTRCVNPGPCGMPCGHLAPRYRRDYELVLGAWDRAVGRHADQAFKTAAPKPIA